MTLIEVSAKLGEDHNMLLNSFASLIWTLRGYAAPRQLAGCYAPIEVAG